MSWLDKILPPKMQSEAKKSAMPDGLWVKCPACEEVLYKSDLEDNEYVCPKCDHHLRVKARDRINRLLDADGRVELGQEVKPVDSLKFKDSRKYTERLAEAVKNTGESEALVVQAGTIHEQPLVIACMDFEFIGGSLGSVMGERIARAVDYCLEHSTPLMIICKSGGARMMESAFSLMQLAKVSGKLSQMTDARIPYISFLTDPSFGGISASFEMLGDLNIAEPGALIGFAGPRVIKETIKKDLPEGFQRSEFLLEHGFLDFIVDRKELKERLNTLLLLFNN